MRRTTTMTVRVSGTLSDFVAANVGESSAYECVSEYVRDLTRRDRAWLEREIFLRLKAEPARTYVVPKDTYHALSASDVIEKNRVQPGA